MTTIMTSKKSLFLALQILLLASLSHAWITPTLPTTTSTLRRISTKLQSTTDRHSSSSSSNKKDPVEMARLSLEMHWNLEEATKSKECVVEDPSTCGNEECQTCHGKGKVACRFCRGTKMMYVGSGEFPQYNNMKASGDDGGVFASCPICHAKGTETCGDCRGTGWIAEWTHLADDFDEEEDEDSDFYGYGYDSRNLKP